MIDSGFRDAITIGRDWADCATACAWMLGPCGGPNCLGFLYVTERLAPDLGAILSLVRETTGVEHWVGGVGSGVCGRRREVHGAAAVSAMVACLPSDSFRLLGTLVCSGDMPEPDIMDWIGSVSPVLGIVHGDSDNSQLSLILEDLTDITDGYLVGGLTAGGRLGRAVPNQLAGLPTRGGLSGVLLSAHVPVAVGGTQGCVQVGDYHIVTETNRTAIARLDSRRPLDVLCEETGRQVPR